jgi:DNA-binding MarR family transcriptional regulator
MIEKKQNRTADATAAGADVKADADVGAVARQTALQNLRIVIRSAQRHSAEIERQCGVSGAQLWVLQELADQPGLRVGEIAALLAIHQTTASNLVDSVVKLGHVDKQRGDSDRRVVRLTLSAQGAALIAAAPQPTRGLLPAALARLDAAQLDQVNGGLAVLLASLVSADKDLGLLPLPFTE